ncbi:MAG: GAF domain-containing protein [Bernardetiaceae bacterium]|nr:GAF domain-containing protein [Bernardetiaceae bacterium]
MPEKNYFNRFSNYDVADTIVWTSFVVGLILATFFQSWSIAIVAGGLNLFLYLTVRYIWNNEELLKWFSPLVYAFFIFQYLAQMSGSYAFQWLIAFYAVSLIRFRKPILFVIFGLLIVCYHGALFYIDYQKFYDLQPYFINLNWDMKDLVWHLLFLSAFLLLCAFLSVVYQKIQLRFEHTEALREAEIKQKKRTLDYMNNLIEGNTGIDYEGFEGDKLYKPLKNIEQKLQEAIIKDQNRKKIIDGMAMFAELMSRHNEDLQSLYDKLTFALVRFLNAAQAGLFISNENGVYAEEEEGQEAEIVLKSFYAYDRKKILEKSMYPGEGILGQTFLEGKITYMTDLPKRYTYIQHGLDEVQPRSVVLVPLISSDMKVGILEIVSLYEMEDYQLDFLDRLSESIATTIHNTHMNEQTQMLLEASQQYSEQLSTAEEQMRGFIEELRLTQKDANNRIADLTQELHNIEMRFFKVNSENKKLRAENQKLKENKASANQYLIVGED